MSKFKLKRTEQPREANTNLSFGVSNERFDEIRQRLGDEIGKCEQANGDDDYDITIAAAEASKICVNKEELFLLGLYVGGFMQYVGDQEDDDDDLIEVDLNDPEVVKVLGGLLHDPRQYHD